MNYYARHLGDYAKDTHHLTLMEHGVLNLLLDRLYSSEKPFSHKEAYQICRPTTKAEKQAVERVLTDYFVDTGSGFVNHRALREIEKYHEKSNKARQSVRARWDKKPDTNVLRTNNERNTDAILSNNQYPITNNPKPITGPLASVVRQLKPK